MILTNFLPLVLTLSPLTVRHNPAPMVTELERAGFEIRFKQENPIDRSLRVFAETGQVKMAAKRASDSLHISAMASTRPTDKDIKVAYREWMYKVVGVQFTSEFPGSSSTSSGFPLGEQFHVHISTSPDRAFAIETYSSGVMFTTDALLMKIGKDERGFAKRSDQPADSARLLECVARWQLGTLEALFGTKGSVTLGNRQLPSLRIGEHTFVSGKALCQAKGWNYQLDNLTAQLRFTTPKGKVIVPLASPEVQLGGARLKYGGITVAVGDDIYVPLGLAQAVW